MRGPPVGLPPAQSRPPAGHGRGAFFFLVTFAAVFLTALQLMGMLGL